MKISGHPQILPQEAPRALYRPPAPQGGLTGLPAVEAGPVESLYLQAPAPPSVPVEPAPSAEPPLLAEQPPAAPLALEEPRLSPALGADSKTFGFGTGENPTSLVVLDDTAAVGEGASAAMSPSEAAALLEIRSELGEHPLLAHVLERFLTDRDHPMNLVAYLKNPESRPCALAHLKAMGELGPLDTEEMQGTVEASQASSAPLLSGDDARFNRSGGVSKSQLLREELLEQDPGLYSMGDDPTPEQRTKLDSHARRLRSRILPSLIEELEGLVADLPGGNGFPSVNARAKSADGILDKIGRMRQGNGGKAPRPGYALADMPDAVGGRITVRTPEELQTVMGRLEERFGEGRIYEKDNFYSNPSKRLSPYRVITYTVVQDGVPCEVQLTTLASSMAADLWHNTGYKPIHKNLPQGTLVYLDGLQCAVTAEEHRLLGKAP